jgi:endonuclease/exonuclease/phosphatase (EEP) superfamily protein YafD
MLERIFYLLTLGLFLSSSAQAIPGPLSRYYESVPIEEAHRTAGYASEEALNPAAIKVLVWNIFRAKKDLWDEEFQKFGESKDLFLIQEFFQSPRFIETIKSFSMVRWDLGLTYLYRQRNGAGTGNMVGSSAEPSMILIKHSHCHEPILKTPKAMAISKYPLFGRNEELLVISVHAINFTRNNCFRDHIKQAIDEVKKHQGPVLLAGDFNTHHQARTNYLMKAIREVGLSPVKFIDGHLRMKFGRHYLDHSFVRGLDVKHARVFGNAKGSDHKPMVLEVSVP